MELDGSSQRIASLARAHPSMPAKQVEGAKQPHAFASPHLILGLCCLAGGGHPQGSSESQDCSVCCTHQQQGEALICPVTYLAQFRCMKLCIGEATHWNFNTFKIPTVTAAVFGMIVKSAIACCYVQSWAFSTATAPTLHPPWSTNAKCCLPAMAMRSPIPAWSAYPLV